MPRTLTRHKAQAGFTLIEIAVVAPIVIIAITGILALLINLMGNNLAARQEVAIVHEANAALNTIEDDVKLTSQFLITTDPAFTDPYGPDSAGDSWYYKGDGAGDRELILRAYATTLSPRHSNKQPVYINENGCAADTILSNPALTTNIIYFLRDNDLYRRTLTRTDQTTCAPQFQRQSCPPDLASPNAICQTNDELMIADINTFDVRYYASPESTTELDVYSSTDPDILQNANTIEVELTIDRRLSGRPFELTRTLRVSKLN